MQVKCFFMMYCSKEHSLSVFVIYGLVREEQQQQCQLRAQHASGPISLHTMIYTAAHAVYKWLHAQEIHKTRWHIV